ncbi:putative short-chain dehydrogenase [Viridothelium virens]|uniref:Putative short-chain dehydrogenase n=1 Tax=Viridothelium virens TaxID=1048519 RepID=A0A6A6GU57_VIRVR|nr:putative short-chain dehydrogenase [Viridothelium virens]
MSKTSPIVLILGAGPNIGQSVTRAFKEKGYRVALASRRAEEAESTSDEIYIPSDFSDSGAIVNIFSKVKALLGIPSVVVYNASAVTFTPPDDPLSLSLADFDQHLKINTVSPFVAAQQAATGFAELPDTASRTFIYTGNLLNTVTVPKFFDLGVGKSATAQIIEYAATAYKDRGFKFYYGDERNADGSPMYTGLSGEAHAKLYVELAEGKTQGPWQQTFVNGVGYKHFPVA